jgi:hypothetical protein
LEPTPSALRCTAKASAIIFRPPVYDFSRSHASFQRLRTVNFRWGTVMKLSHMFALACSFLVASAAQAQVRGQTPGQRQAAAPVPTNLQPPVGMCRILLDGVAPAQQPAPTNCEAAIKNRPANGRVIFGNDFARPDAKKGDADAKRGDPGLKGVVPPPATGDVKAPDPKASEKKVDDKKVDSKKPEAKAPPRKPPGRHSTPDAV